MVDPSLYRKLVVYRPTLFRDATKRFTGRRVRSEVYTWRPERDECVHPGRRAHSRGAAIFGCVSRGARRIPESSIPPGSVDNAPCLGNGNGPGHQKNFSFCTVYGQTGSLIMLRSIRSPNEAHQFSTLHSGRPRGPSSRSRRHAVTIAALAPYSGRPRGPSSRSRRRAVSIAAH